MLNFTIRRLLLAIPTLLFISLVIFLLLEASPGDPLGDVPLTVPPEVRDRMRAALGLGEPWPIRYVLWLKQFFWVEPLYWFDQAFGTGFSDAEREHPPPPGSVVSFSYRGATAAGVPRFASFLRRREDD